MPLGVYFALTGEEKDNLLADSKIDEDAVMNFVSELEEEWPAECLCEIDNAGTGIFFALLQSSPESAKILKNVTFGDHQLEADEGYLVSLIPCDELPDLMKELDKIDERAFRELYGKINPNEYPNKSDADLGYTWIHFKEMKEFFRKCADMQWISILYTTEV